jgi:hypothetical protein
MTNDAFLALAQTMQGQTGGQGGSGVFEGGGGSVGVGPHPHLASGEEQTPIERYFNQRYSLHPYIPIYVTDIDDWLQKYDQRRIDAMDPWDYQLELDCAALCEFDSQLSKEVKSERIPLLRRIPQARHPSGIRRWGSYH